MGEPRFRMRVCGSCGLRFPEILESPLGKRCPACSGQTSQSGHKFGRHAVPKSSPGAGSPVKAVLLDNIRSAWNVGAIFRTAEGAGVAHLYLCGISPSPENERVRKTALGAEARVGWSYHPDGLAAVQDLKTRGQRFWALEGGQGSVPLRAAPPDQEMVWVVGNENAGVDPAILKECEARYYIPLVGQKESLNVVVALGVALFNS